MKKSLLVALTLMASVCGASAQKVAMSSIAKNYSSASNMAQEKVEKAPISLEGFEKGNKSGWLDLSKLGAGKAQGKLGKLGKTAKPAKAASSSTTWWGYPVSSLGLYGWGFTDYSMGICSMADMEGAVIDSIAVLFYDKQYISNVQVWASGDSLPAPKADLSAIDDLSYENVSSLNDYVSYYNGETDGYYTIIKLSKPFTVPKGGAIFGYSFTTDYQKGQQNYYGNYPVITGGSGAVNGGFFMNIGDGSIYTMYDQTGEYDYGNLLVMVHADLSKCQSAYAYPSEFIETVGLVNQETSGTLGIENAGTAPITSVSYVATFNGVEQPEVEEQLTSAIYSFETGYVYPSVTPTEEGENAVSYKITKVNGVANMLDEQYQTLEDAVVIGITESAKRLPVVEEFTSNTCGWCPRGAVALEKLKEAYGDSIVVAAGHVQYSRNYTDPMQCTNYVDVINSYASSFPGAAYERAAVADPYHPLSYYYGYDFSADQYVKMVDQFYPSEGTITMSAKWADNAGSKIDVEVESVINYDRLSSPYGVAFLLTEDGMSGAAKNYWFQYNYFSTTVNPTIANYYSSDDFSWWFSQGQIAYPESFNHVVVGAWDALSGNQDAVEAPISKGEEQGWSTTLDLSSNKLIQDKKNLTLIALLINSNNGQIVNAAQMKMPAPVDGINGVKSEASNAKEVARYNAAGARTTAKGLNIVKMSDGTVKKVIVK